MIQKKQNFNDGKFDNVVLLSIPYNVLISIVTVFMLFITVILFYFNSKLSFADKAIHDLQKQSHLLSETVNSLNEKNQKLLELLTDITHKNLYLEELVGDMLIENAKLLITIFTLQETFAKMEGKIAFTPNIIDKLILNWKPK